MTNDRVLITYFGKEGERIDVLPLTEGELRCFNAIVNFVDRSSVPPTIRETAEILDISSTATDYYFQTLIEKGWIYPIVGPGGRRYSRGLVIPDEVRGLFEDDSVEVLVEQSSPSPA